VRARLEIAVIASVVVVVSIAVVAVAAARPDGRRTPIQAPSASAQAPPSSGPPAPPTPAIDLTAARPAEEVWPDAVIRLPRRLPDGRSFIPWERLDDHRFLVVPTSDNANRLPVVYDARARRTVDLITGQPQADTELLKSVVTVSERDIVIVATWGWAGAQASATAEVWVAPRWGGPATRRAVFEDPTKVGAFGVGDAVFATVTAGQENATTVYRLPAGRLPEQVARAEKVPHPPYGRWFMAGPARSSHNVEPSAPSTFLDVVTGERRTTTALSGLIHITCSPETCVGADRVGIVAYRFDGTNPTRLEGFAKETLDNFAPIITATGRFIRLHTGTFREYLWDHQRNVVVIVDSLGSHIGQLQPLRHTDDEQFLLDLSRIA
jgi:hypothetical protein